MATYTELLATRKEIVIRMLAIAYDPNGDPSEVERLKVEASTIAGLMARENPSAEEMQGVAITS